MTPSMFLFLCSSFSSVATLLPEASPIELSGRVVTFIPTASIHESYKAYVKSGQKALEKLGLKVEVLDVAEASSEEIEATLSRGDLIYITGGNTFYLLQELQRKGADQMIRREIEAGKPYIGESAGTMILAPSIEYVQLMDKASVAPELTSHQALGIISKYPLPHYKNFPFVKVGDKVVATYGEKLPLVPITNHQALVIRGDEWRVVTKE